MRDYAAKLAEKEQVSTSEAIDLAREQGMAEMSEKFLAAGAEVYVAEGSEPRQGGLTRAFAAAKLTP